MGRIVRCLVLAVLAVTALSCTDSDEVNAAFSQTRVSWYVFDGDRPDGLRPLPGFEQPQKVVWAPRTQAVRATSAVPGPDRTGAVAVSRLGLLILEDRDGTLGSFRPGALVPLAAYQTDRVFVCQDKVFITLYQEPVGNAAPASLAWWGAGQPRVAFYPVPSQVRNPARQAVGFEAPLPGTSEVGMTWKVPAGDGWTFEKTVLSLNDGAETVVTGTVGDVDTAPDPVADRSFDGVRARLAERLGTGVAAQEVRGTATRLLVTETGWVAVGRVDGGRARLYRLPELGSAGRYTGALALSKGWVFTWETAYRGYVGAAGLVHVPAAVLAP